MLVTLLFGNDEAGRYVTEACSVDMILKGIVFAICLTLSRVSFFFLPSSGQLLSFVSLLSLLRTSTPSLARRRVVMLDVDCGGQ